MYQDHPAVLEDRLRDNPARDEIQSTGKGKVTPCSPISNLQSPILNLQFFRTTSNHHTSTQEDPIHDRKPTS